MESQVEVFNDDLTAPSVLRKPKPALCEVSGARYGGVKATCNDQCRVRRDQWCQTHDCMTKKYVVTSKVWKYIERKKEYGYVSMKKTKVMCLSKKRKQMTHHPQWD